MEEKNFNAWMDHLSRQLQADYRKLYYTSKIKKNDTVIQKLPRGKAADLHRI